MRLIIKQKHNSSDYSQKIEAINNRPPKEFINKNNESFWFVDGERRISWFKVPPSNKSSYRR